MAERKIHDDGNSQRQQSLAQNILERLTIFFRAFGLRVFATGVDADGDACDLLQQACVQQMRQQSVEAIRWLVEVLEKKDFVFERGLERRRERGAKQRDVSTNQLA